MFGNARLDDILSEIRLLGTRIDNAISPRRANDLEEKLANAEAKLEKTSRELVAKEIEFDRETEKWERAKRETEHMIGLEKKRQDQEIELGKRDAVLTVREENLTKDRDRFEAEMKFTRERLETELESSQKLMHEILSRLPTVHVDRTIAEARNGADADKVPVS